MTVTLTDCVSIAQRIAEHKLGYPASTEAKNWKPILSEHREEITKISDEVNMLYDKRIEEFLAHHEKVI